MIGADGSNAITYNLSSCIISSRRSLSSSPHRYTVYPNLEPSYLIAIPAVLMLVLPAAESS
ncbi:MAG: hypothetical protein AB8U34_00345, partial [Anaplasma ovis]